MAAFAGLRGSGSWGTDERPKNFREAILWMNPNGSAPLTALLARARKESVDDPEFNWWTEKLSPIRVKTSFSTGYISTANTVTIVGAGSTSSGGLVLVAGDLLMLEKAETTTYANEIAMVSSVTSDTVIVLKRGVAGTANVAIVDADYFTKIGNAFEEGSAGPDVSTRNPVKATNYCQIFKTAIGITGTAAEIKARTGDPWSNDKKRKIFDHSIDMEMAFLFGVPYEDTTGTYPKRYTGGLRSFLTTNVTIFATSPTETTFLNALYHVFDYSKNSGAGDERIVLAGNGFMNNLNKLARSGTGVNLNYEGIMKVYGMSLQKWVLPQGTFGFKTHPLMNLHGRFTNSAFVIDPSNLIYRPLRDTKLKDHTEENDEDLHEAIWLTEVGLEVQHEETMAYIGNFVI